MLRSVLQSATSGFYVFASDSATPTSGKTGLTITATLSKIGAAANSVSPTITEIGNGLYWVAPATAHRDTLGEIAWQFSGSGAIIAPRLEKVVAVNDQSARFGASDGTNVTLAAAERIKLHATQPDYAPLLSSGYTAPSNSTIALIYALLQLTDASVSTMPANVRAAILDRVLSGNHETAGSVGKLLQNLDVLLSTRATPAQVTAALDSISATALARFATVNTGQVAAVAGSVAALSQGAGGGGGGLTEDEGLQLDRIESQTAKLSGTPVIVNGNVKPGGQIVLHYGDNHTVAGGNPVIVGVDDVGGSLHTLMAAVGVGNLQVAAIRGADTASRIVGTVAALSYASNILSVTLEFTSVESAKGIVGPAYVYDVIRTSTPTRTYFSGKLTVTRDART